MNSKKTFMGYRRPDGGAGIRNHVAIVSNVVCINSVVDQIVNAVPGTIPVTHTEGCTRPIERASHISTLAGLATNPNIYGAVVVSLGCESNPVAELVRKIAETGRPVELIVVQDHGTIKSFETGASIAKRLVQEAAALERVECSVSELMIGLECGGSDALSGVTANPAIGMLSDWIVENGGTTVLTEMTELIGTNNLLARRCRSAEVAKAVIEAVDRAQDHIRKILGDRAGRAISIGNMAGGMTTIQEKALGCINKGGTSTINEIVAFGEKPAEKGLVIMDGPGFDPVSITGLSAMGCQMIFFTTGCGNPLGHVVSPIVKVGSNDELYERMAENIDINCGVMLEEEYEFENMKEDMINLTLRVANGDLTKAEVHDPRPMVCLLSWNYPA